jgi:hypothetical protein
MNTYCRLVETVEGGWEDEDWTRRCHRLNALRYPSGNHYYFYHFVDTASLPRNTYKGLISSVRARNADL